MRMRAVVLLVFLLTTLFFDSCASRERSVVLSLALTPGMEKTMKISTEQHLSGANPGGSTFISFTYKFHVISVSASGVAKVESSVLDVTAAKGIPEAAAYIESLRRQKFVVTVDARGRVLDMSTDQPGGVALPGLPRAPGSSSQMAPAQGDIGAFFEGLNGQRVSVGETWTSPLSPSGGSGLRGTLRWTLASVGGSTARLDYTGTLEKQQVPLPSLPDSAQAFLSGDATGFVELEKETGWPRHGKMVIHANVSLPEKSAAAGSTAVLVSMGIVTQFDAVR